MYTVHISIIIILLVTIKHSRAVQCSSNPCRLDDDQFRPPHYTCIQLLNNQHTVVCTCPNGQGRENAPCRICDRVDCGPTGVCIERELRPGSFYACGCINSTGNYLNFGPCPAPLTTTTTTTTSTSTPPLPICLNGGVYNMVTTSCLCPPYFTGASCELSIGQELCRDIRCANGGVCNSVPTANNGVEAQCWCLNGFAGSNCELIGNAGRCTPGLCQNGGTCEEARLGTSIFAYCRCLPGVTGQRCERFYFTCSQSGLFADSVQCLYGRYFQCIGTSLIARSCPKGSRYNPITMQCALKFSCF